MSCKKCPHHVRHGQVGKDKKTIEFKDRCGLKMKDNVDLACSHYPFPNRFDYQECAVYQDTFKSGTQRNDVVPTSDIQYSERMVSNPITDMEYL